MIASPKTNRVKKFIFSPHTVRIAAIALFVLILSFAFIFHDYLIYRKQATELQELRAETYSQQKEILSFIEKITFMEEQLKRLKEMEKQVEKDLKEIHELRKTKKNAPAVPPKKTSGEIKERGKEIALFRKEEIAILEKERSRLASHLHQNLLLLRKEALQRENHLEELQEFLQTQKSALLATPSLWPVLGCITSEFGDTRLSSSAGGTRPHLGLDISAPRGTPVLASASGVVHSAGREPEYGLLISLDHGHGFTTVYGHLKTALVKVGDRVKMGQIIGTVGNSGNSTGPHLHYEVRIHGNPVNPRRYLHHHAP